MNGTNNTGAALDWTAAFTLTEAGTIYDTWNGSFTQSGDAVVVSGIDWNNILDPGESLLDVGFCVNRAAGTDAQHLHLERGQHRQRDSHVLASRYHLRQRLHRELHRGTGVS